MRTELRREFYEGKCLKIIGKREKWVLRNPSLVLGCLVNGYATLKKMVGGCLGEITGFIHFGLQQWRRTWPGHMYLRVPSSEVGYVGEGMRFPSDWQCVEGSQNRALANAEGEGEGMQSTVGNGGIRQVREETTWYSRNQIMREFQEQ